MDVYRLGNERLSAAVMPFGATLVDLRLAGWGAPLVLGFERLEDYALADHYAGAVIGRVANRIARGRAVVDGTAIELPLHPSGHHLHGGATGLARQHWQVVETARDRVRLACKSPDGHEGYPGNADFEVLYEVAPPATLRIAFSATTDRPTLVNLCQHPYFNFTGEPDIFGHSLEIAADRYTASSAELVPTGEIRDVAGTPFDFRHARQLGTQRIDPGFNHNYCLAETTREAPAFAARVAVEGGPAMELWTTQPGLHLYDGYKLRPGGTGLGGRTYGPNGGLCLEAQGWPDSPNHPHFPSIELRPGDTYRQNTEYRFTLPAE
jgi:aldose 1-epimerase